MRSRLEYIHFPKLDEKVFKKVIREKIFEEVKAFNPKFVSASQLEQFVDHLDSDLRTFSDYCKYFDGNFESMNLFFLIYL